MPDSASRALAVRLACVVALGSTFACASDTTTATQQLKTASIDKGASADVLPLGGSLDVSSGNGQTVVMGAPAAVPLAVKFVPGAGRSIFQMMVSWAITSGQGTLSGASMFPDASGRVSASFTAGSTPGPVVVTASVAGLPAVRFNMNVVALTPPIVTSISRDGGSAAGGAIVRISGEDFSATDIVRFGTGQATSVTRIDSKTLQVTTPAGTPGLVGVSVARAVVTSGGTTSGATAVLPSVWTYYPAPTTYLVNSDMESGNIIPGLQTSDVARPDGDSAYVSTEQAHTGTHSIKSVATRPFTNGSVVIGFAPQNDIVGGNGRYHRWYMYMPASTLASTLKSGQIKLFLSRAPHPSYGFDMIGVGLEFAGLNRLTTAIDQNVQFISWSPVVTPDTWHEIQVWEYRDPVAHIGYTKVWWNGKLVAQASSPDLGDDNPLTIRDYEMGIAYTQNAAGPLTVFIDDVKIGNGYMDPPKTALGGPI